MSMDVNRVGSLLHICDMSKNWPGLRGIHDLAMVQLEAISVDASKELVDRKVKLAQAEAERAAKIKADEEQKAIEAEKAAVADAGRPAWIEPGPPNEAEVENVNRRL